MKEKKVKPMTRFDLDQRQRIVSAYLDMAELQAMRPP
jgi:hypothetical protein